MVCSPESHDDTKGTNFPTKKAACSNSVVFSTEVLVSVKTGSFSYLYLCKTGSFSKFFLEEKNIYDAY